MASKLIVFVVLLGIVQVSLCAVAREIAPVTDEKLKAQGYTCQNDLLGPMKNGQENNNYSQTVCGSVSCSDGVFTYFTCGLTGFPPGVAVVPEDPTKPYPECCTHAE